MEAHLEISESLMWEVSFLAKTLALGLGIRCGYDLLIVFRRFVKHGSLWTGIEDSLYCAFGAVVTFALFYTENQGTPRGFALFGVITGMLVYHFGPSGPVCWILEKILRLITYPIKIFIIFLRKVVKKC